MCELSKFPPGQLYVTQGIEGLLSENTLTEIQLQTILARHLAGDWGDLCESDKQQNELALKNKERLFSCYTIGKTKVYIITEADRSATTLLLPEEY